jgi:hypothetical protein
VQTFLPYRDFARSAEVLDSPRLGKQRVETLQVLRALELGDYGWRNHPVVRMWRGRTPALVAYGLAVVHAWRARGHADSTHELIAEFAPGARMLTQQELAAGGLLPGWLGDDRIHRSHRSALVRKDSEFYRPVFGDVPDDLPYHWPEPDDLPAPAPPRGHPLWVVRAATGDAARAFLEQGYAALAEPGPRSAKGRRQLEAFSAGVRPGDLVGLPLDGGTHLVVGEVTGPHREARTDGGDVEHRRAVRWYGELPRSAVHPSAQLQDPRSFFLVHLAEGAEEAEGAGADGVRAPRLLRGG